MDVTAIDQKAFALLVFCLVSISGLNSIPKFNRVVLDQFRAQLANKIVIRTPVEISKI